MTTPITIIPLAARINVTAGKLVGAEGIIEFAESKQPFTVAFGDVIELPPPPNVPWEDRVRDMPVNEAPDHPSFVQRAWYQWPGRTENPEGVTIHHTLSHSPEALADYCTRSVSAGGKGYPTTQYHFWVSAGDGCPIWRLVPVDFQVWHDHTGAFQKTISVGLAGRLHETAPPQEQLEAAGVLVRWLMAEYNIPLREVVGHCDRYSGTVCPGWNQAGWRDAFYEAVNGS